MALDGQRMFPIQVSFSLIFIFNVTQALSSEYYLLHRLRLSLTWSCPLVLLCKLSLPATHRVIALDHFASCYVEGVWANLSETPSRKWTGGDQNE